MCWDLKVTNCSLTAHRPHPQSPHTLREVHEAAELASAFKSREVSATAFYSGPFAISEDFEFRVGTCRAVWPAERGRASAALLVGF